METPLTTVQFLQILGLLGLPVHLLLALCSGALFRRRLALHWMKVCVLVLGVLAMALFLQAIAWQFGPELPEELFMIFGFINTPALFGATAILGTMLALVPRRVSTGASSSRTITKNGS